MHRPRAIDSHAVAAALLTLTALAWPSRAVAPASRPLPDRATSGLVRPPAAPPVDRALRPRVTEYWEARGRLNLPTAYTFYEPGFRRVCSRQSFIAVFRGLARTPVRFQGIDYIALDSTGRRAEVGVRLLVTPDGPDGRTLIDVRRETWLLDGGIWWRRGEPMPSAL